jgi:hypothetical protein
VKKKMKTKKQSNRLSNLKILFRLLIEVLFYPELRFGQIMTTTNLVERAEGNVMFWSDDYYVSSETILSRMKKVNLDGSNR